MDVIGVHQSCDMVFGTFAAKDTIDIPVDYYRDVMRRQAVGNAGVTFRLKNETAAGKFETEEFVYEHGIEDYMPLISDWEHESSKSPIRPNVSGV